MPKNNFLEKIGIGISSLTFGVALSIFIYAYVTQVSSLMSYLLFIATFLIMLRFFYRYVFIIVKEIPSSIYWHFLLDFAIAFFGILAVLQVNNLFNWSLAIGASMLASVVRSLLSFKNARGNVLKSLKRMCYNAVGLLIFMIIILVLSPFISNYILSLTILSVIVIFIIYASFKE